MSVMTTERNAAPPRIERLKVQNFRPLHDVFLLELISVDVRISDVEQTTQAATRTARRSIQPCFPGRA